MAPGARQGRQAGDITHGHAAAMHALHAVVGADGRAVAVAAGLAIQARQRHHFRGGDTAHFGHALGRPFQGPLFQFSITYGVLRNIVMVDQLFRDQDMHQAQRQGRIGTGQQGDVLVAFLGRQRAVGIDGDQGRAIALGFLRAHPEVQIRSDRIAAPDDDQFRVLELLQVRADAGAHRVAVARGAGRGADGAVQQGRAQLVEKTRGHRFALHQAHGAAVAVWQDRLRIARGDRFQAGRDGRQRLIPADALELAFALLAHAAQRGQQAVRMVGALREARDLGAQHARRGRMVGIALDRRGDPISHRDQQGTRIGAIERAGGPHLGGGHGSSRKRWRKAIL